MSLKEKNPQALATVGKPVQGPTREGSLAEAGYDATLNDGRDLERRYLDMEKYDTEAPISPPEESDPRLEDGDFPDGGTQAWLVVLGALCANISAFGYVNSWGAFQAYYESVVLTTTTPSTIAWIGSIQYALVFLPALLTGRMFDLGYFKIPFFAASVLLVVATFLIAQCTQYWQFLLCQGFAVGLSCGFIFGPVMGIISHWFKRRRAMALGIIACGSSIGGTVFPIAFRNLVATVGFKWTMRIFGFILICTLGVANVTLKRRLPPVNVSGGLLNLKVFRSPAFTVYTIASFVAFLGLYTVLTYIDASGPTQGVNSDFSFYLVAIANASSGFGRLMAGFVADRIGALNIMIPFTVLAAVFTFIWPFVYGQTALIIIAVFYGFASGAFVGLLIAPMIAMGDTADVGRRSGMYMTLLSFGALAGPPISGAINTATGGYKAVGIYAGTSIMVAVVLMCATRHLVLKSLWGRF